MYNLKMYNLQFRESVVEKYPYDLSLFIPYGELILFISISIDIHSLREMIYCMPK